MRKYFVILAIVFICSLAWGQNNPGSVNDPIWTGGEVKLINSSGEILEGNWILGEIVLYGEYIAEEEEEAIKRVKDVNVKGGVNIQ